MDPNEILKECVSYVINVSLISDCLFTCSIWELSCLIRWFRWGLHHAVNLKRENG